MTVTVDVVDRWQLHALLTRDDALEHWERMAAAGSGATEETGARFRKTTVVPEILREVIGQSEWKFDAVDVSEGAVVVLGGCCGGQGQDGGDGG